MLCQQIIQIMKIYSTKLADMGYGPEENKDDRTKELNHVHNCCQQVITWATNMFNGEHVDFEKIHRWIGFIQGVLWCRGIYTIDEMGEHNRSTGNG